MIKKVIVVILTSLVQYGVHALFCQNVSYLPSSYDRISLTVFYLENPLSNSTKKYVENVVYSDKYDNNNFDSPFLWVNFNNEGGGYKDQILNELNRSGVGKKSYRSGICENPMER